MQVFVSFPSYNVINNATEGYFERSLFSVWSAKICLEDETEQKSMLFAEKTNIMK